MINLRELESALKAYLLAVALCRCSAYATCLTEFRVLVFLATQQGEMDLRATPRVVSNFLLIRYGEFPLEFGAWVSAPRLLFLLIFLR